MSGPEIVTFGCRLNAYESEAIRAATAGRDDLVIVNTCAVTAEAERQARQAIRRLRRERPNACIVVTGCAAQINPGAFAAMPEVDRVLGNSEKFRPERYADTEARVTVGDIMAVRETAGHLAAGFRERVRAFVQVQNGCDHRCTFCIIPYGRGPSRSVPTSRIEEELKALVAAGYREIVLTGVDLTSYGGDLPERPQLGGMIRGLLDAVPGLARLRLSSVDPAEVDDDLFRLFAEEGRLMPHLHLSLQSGDDLILKRMKRRHSRADVVRLCERLREVRPDIAFGADLIAGFPTETEEMAAGTRSLLDECGIAFLHVFPFSPRVGTPAARMPQLPVALRRERAAQLREQGVVLRRRFLAGLVGATADVLVEDGSFGRTEHFAPVRVDRESHLGALVKARLEAVEGEELRARVLA